VRLSVLYREPLARVMDWPVSHVRLIATYLSREPAPDERIELALAQIATMYANSHRPKDRPPAKLVDFLPARDAWKAAPAITPSSDRYSESDRLMLSALMNRSPPL